MKRNGEKLAKILVRCMIGEGIVLVIVLILFIGIKINNRVKAGKDQKTNAPGTTQVLGNSEEGGNGSEQVITPEEEKSPTKEELEALALEEQKAERRRIALADANTLASGYDYDKAIEILTSYEEYATDEEMQTAVASYEKAKDTLVPFGAYENPGEISHIFFHSLIADTSKAFDGDDMSDGYNNWMTTVDEFKKILGQMYERGYVLVSIHDVAKEKKQEDGSTKMVAGDIMLPKDKKPFVLSQDDVNFYEYMRTDGFATRIVIDDDGKPACEINLDGKMTVGRDYDVVPILEKFIEEHPDFSYHGARGIIGVTGYEGVIGYRTNEKDSDTYEQDLKDAKAVANRLKEMGWEFASHSYGHRDLGKKSEEFVKEDSQKWEKDIASIVGETDILLYPYGGDIIQGIGKYTGSKYETLYNHGFRYYCGVCAYPWLQINDKYVRMSRRNLDGFAMFTRPDRLQDLYDVSEVIDAARPALK